MIIQEGPEGHAWGIPNTLAPFSEEKEMLSLGTNLYGSRVLIFLACGLLAGGCGTVVAPGTSRVESNQAACRRVFDRAVDCAGVATEVPREFDSWVSSLCATVPNGAACGEWPALTDCLTSVPCDELLINPEPFVPCQAVADRLENKGCFPTDNRYEKAIHAPCASCDLFYAMVDLLMGSHR